jgi:alpha-tubulin suppressor-like RCC1 family protein
MAWCGPHMTVVMVRGEDERCETVYFGKDRFCFRSSHMSFVRTPTPLLFCRQPVHAVQVAFGEKHMAVVTGCKQLFMAGSNAFGQLGRGHTWACDSYFPLVRAPGSDGQVQSAACGSSHTLVVLESGGESIVMGCGKNCSGQLAAVYFPPDKYKTCYTTWTDMDLTALRAQQSTSGPVRVAAGARHSVISVGDAVATVGKVANAGSVSANPLSSDTACRWKVHTDVPWRGTAIKHLVSGLDHVLLGVATGNRLHVYGWGTNDCCQLGYPAFESTEFVVETPSRLWFDCPEQPSNTFPSMLAAGAGSSMVMVGGEVWCMWSPSESAKDLHVAAFRKMERSHFNGLAIAFISIGATQDCFATTCGKLFMSGFQEDDDVEGDNGIPTSFRKLRHGVKGLCEPDSLTVPTIVPSQLLLDKPVHVSMPSTHKVAFLMGTHKRLGGQSKHGKKAGRCLLLHVDQLVLQMILNIAETIAQPVLV